MTAPFTGLLLDLDNDKRPLWEPGAKPFTECLLFAADGEYPEEIDPRGWHRLEHQQRSDCEGHANTSTGEAAYVITTGEIIQFSPHFQYRVDQEQDGIQGDNGATISGGLKAAMEIGYCPLELCPYPDRYSSPITQEMRDAAANFRIGSYTIPKSYRDAFALIVSGIAINWGLGWSFSTGATRWVLENFSGNGPGHATSLCGYSRRKDKAGLNYLWLANSGYPTPGYYEVAPYAVDKALDDSWTVAIGMSKLSAPLPPPKRYNVLGV